ncbi:MAG: hypothetical protein WED11_07675 [Natronospirillum sp.]
MTATYRQLISLLLSLFLVMGGSALALAEIPGVQPNSAMADCGSLVMAQADSTGSLSDADSNCTTMPDMVCSSAMGLSNCGVISLGLLLTALENHIDVGSQPVIGSRATIYQDPFLTTVTPPPLNRI